MGDATRENKNVIAIDKHDKHQVLTDACKAFHNAIVAAGLDESLAGAAVDGVLSHFLNQSANRDDYSYDARRALLMAYDVLDANDALESCLKWTFDDLRGGLRDDLRDDPESAFADDPESVLGGDEHDSASSDGKLEGVLADDERIIAAAKDIALRKGDADGIALIARWLTKARRHEQAQRIADEAARLGLFVDAREILDRAEGERRERYESIIEGVFIERAEAADLDPEFPDNVFRVRVEGYPLLLDAAFDRFGGFSAASQKHTLMRRYLKAGTICADDERYLLLRAGVADAFTGGRYRLAKRDEDDASEDAASS